MTTYYFADNQTGAHANAAVGNNANAGTSSSLPKRDTVGFNFDALNAGDQCLFAIGGCWIRSTSIIWLEAPASNSATNPIIFGSYDPGGGVTGKPWFKSTAGSYVIVFGGFHGTSPGVFHSGYTVRGLKLDGQNVEGIRCCHVWSNIRNFTIEDCELINGHIGVDSYPGPSAAGVDMNRFFICQRNAFADFIFAGWLGCAEDVLIEANDFLRCGKRTPGNPTDDSGFHHAIYYGAGTAPAPRCVMRHNTLRDSTTDQGYAAGGNLTFRGLMRHTTCEANVVTHSTGAYIGASFGISHIAGYGSAESHYYTTIRGNRVRNMGCGIAVGVCDGLVVENNVIVNDTTGQGGSQGILWDYNGSTSPDLQMVRTTVRHNSFYFANPANNTVAITANNDAGLENIIDNNAMVFGAVQSGASSAFSLNEAAGQEYTSIRNNLVSGATQWHATHTTLSAFESHFNARPETTCSGNIATGSPGLTTPTSGNNYSMAPTSGASPVVDAAYGAGSTKLAIDSAVRGASRDIGAFEAIANPTFTNIANGRGVDETSETSVAIPSITLAANRLALLSVVNVRVPNPVIPTVAGWTLVRSYIVESLQRVSVFRRMSTTSATQGYTIDFGGSAHLFTRWSVDESSATVNITGTNGSGAIVQTAEDFEVGTAIGTYCDITFGSAFASPYNSVFAVFANSATFTPTPGSGFTELSRSGVESSGNRSLFCEYKAANDMVADMTWSTGSDLWNGIAIEIRGG